MADIRKLVKADRGLLKRIQARIPGYEKYRNCEDIRVADNLLRLELAKIVEEAVNNIKKTREEIAKNMDFDLINRIGELVNLSEAVVQKIRHAQQGYAPWISGDVRIEEEELRSLYEYDQSLFGGAEDIMAKALELQKTTTKKLKEKMSELRDEFEKFDRVFTNRISVVTKVAQKKR